MFEGAEAVRAVGAVRRAAHLFPHPEDTSPAALGGEGEGLADPQARAGLQVDRQPVVRLDVPGDEVDLFPGRDRVLVDRTATDPWEFGTVHRAPGDAPFVHRGLEQVADQRHEVVHRARRRLGTEGGDEPVDVRPLHAGERLAAQLRQEVEAQEAVVVAVGVLPDQPTLQPVRGVCADGDGTALGVQEESLVLKVLGPRGELPGLGLHREAHLALTARLSPPAPGTGPSTGARSAASHTDSACCACRSCNAGTPRPYACIGSGRPGPEIRGGCLGALAGDAVTDSALAEPSAQVVVA